MEDVLNEIVSAEDLKKFEKQYHEQLKKGTVNLNTQFEYAWCLVRSKYPADIKKGIILLEGHCDVTPRSCRIEILLQNGDDSKRDYLFYLAIGNAKLREYPQALRYIRTLLSVEATNRQAQELEIVIKKRMEKEGLMGMAIVGGVAVALGSLIGLGIAMSRK